MTYKFIPSGVCTRGITIEINENDIIESVDFIGGCNGNLKGLSSLAEGMKVDDVIEKLQNITCGFKSTSCPDQFALALKKYKAQKGE